MATRAGTAARPGALDARAGRHQAAAQDASRAPCRSNDGRAVPARSPACPERLGSARIEAPRVGAGRLGSRFLSWAGNAARRQSLST